MQRKPGAPRPALRRHAVDETGPLVEVAQLQAGRQLAGVDREVIGQAAGVSGDFEAVDRADLPFGRRDVVVVEVERPGNPGKGSCQHGDDCENFDEP